MSRRRPYPQGDDDDGYDRFCRSKRRRVSEDQEMEEHLETLIYRIGEKSATTLESNLEGLASVLEDYLSKYRAKVLRLLTDCAVKMPEKCTTYSTIAGLMNAKNYNFGGEFVEQMVKIFKDSLKSCSWDTARYTLRFLADLVNCHVVDASSLFKLLDHMLEVAKEDSENIPDVRKSWFIYAVLYCLPWVGRELYEKKEKQLEMLITTIEVLLNKRTKRHVPALRVWSIDVPHTQEEYLDCLWEQVKKLKFDNWQEKHIPRPYLAFDNVLCEALQHTLPVISIPPHSDSFVYPKPTVIFRMFDYTDCPERGPVLPGAHSIERFLIEEHLHQIIENYHLERKECAAHLIEFPYKAKIPLEYCIVEVIFSELFNLPQPRYLEVFYGSLLIELSKLLPTTMPQVLAQATEILFLRIETMNTACFDRLVSWFSYHLSNFQYRWSWEDWQECLKLDHEHPRPKFIKEVLLKTMRLSYHQRIRDIVPRSYDCVLPPRPEPFYKYTAEGSSSLPGTQVAQQLMTAIQRRCSPEDLLAILKELPNPLEGDESSEARYNPLKIDVFVQTLFFLGSKSFSHSFAAIGKFNQVFKLLADGEDAQLCVLKSIYELWRNHQQMMCVLIDKMLKIQLLDCSSVATWIFSKEMSHDFTKMYVWEILHLTINKMSKYVSRLTRELSEAREKLARHGGGNSSSGDESDDSMGGRNDDKPTEEMVERMEERLEAAQSDQKNLFLIIIQRFIMILTEHFARCDTDNKEFDNYWYRWTMGRLQQVFLAHHEQLQQYSSTLESLLFTHDLDLHILDVFHQFIALNS